MKARVGKLFFVAMAAVVAVFVPVPKVAADCGFAFCFHAWQNCRQECRCGSVDYVDCDPVNCDYVCGCGPC
jgi:hypothetical protein